MVLDEAVWPTILGNIKQRYNTLYGILRMARPVYGDDRIELQFGFAFHQKRLNEAKNRKIVADFIKQVTGRDVEVFCTLAPPKPEGAAVSAKTNLPLETISDIFGGGEVLHS